jgi:peptidylprolyl isomerase
MIVDLSETTVTLDANHPMAGFDLNFDLELVEIV